jgi:predicted phage terminase large subunit-like protein
MSVDQNQVLWHNLRKKSLTDLFFFAKAIMGFSWLNEKIHMPLCRLLEAYTENPRLKIVLPRGWLKTTLCSQAYPVWRAIRNPNIRIVLAQNTYSNAVSKLKVIRATFEKNTLFCWLFPELLPDAGCTWKSESLCIKRSGTFAESTFEAAGVQTQLTSRHYELIIEDDTVAPDFNELGEQNLCPTKEDIDQAIGWHRLLPPLLVNPKSDQILVVGTRWFEKDLISWIAENERRFKTYQRACREDAEGNPDPKGQPAYPERFSEEVLEELYTSMGPYLFSCLYLNCPTKGTDMVFHEEWMTYYETLPANQNMAVYTTIDPAGDPEDTKGSPDFNVVMTCAKDLATGLVYVIDYFRKKCSPGELIAAIFKHVKAYHPIKVGVEAIAYQSTLQYWIKEKMRKDGEFFMVEPLPFTRRSKNARIMSLQPLFHSGTVAIRSFMGELLSELLAFPYGKNDDIIDALASQVNMWQMTASKAEKKAATLVDDPMSLAYEIKRAGERIEASEDDVIMMPLTTPCGLAYPGYFKDKTILGYGAR